MTIPFKRIAICFVFVCPLPCWCFSLSTIGFIQPSPKVAGLSLSYPLGIGRNSPFLTSLLFIFYGVPKEPWLSLSPRSEKLQVPTAMPFDVPRQIQEVTKIKCPWNVFGLRIESDCIIWLSTLKVAQLLGSSFIFSNWVVQLQLRCLSCKGGNRLARDRLSWWPDLMASRCQKSRQQRWCMWLLL